MAILCVLLSPYKDNVANFMGNLMAVHVTYNKFFVVFMQIL